MSNSNSSNQSRALATQAPVDLAQVADEHDRRIAALYRAMLPNGNKLTDQEALAGALYAKATGLDPVRGEFYIVPGIGVAPGYKGEQKKKAEKVRFNAGYRQMRPEEAQAHGLATGDIGVICTCIDLDTAVLMRGMGLTYQPAEGIGVVRQDEMWVKEKWEGPYGERRKVNLPRDKWEPAEPVKGRSWLWKAQQRALKDALNHMPGFEEQAAELEEAADEILARAQAEQPNMTMPPEGARLTPEQARAWVRQQARTDEIVAEYRSLPAEEQQARVSRNVETMRGPGGDDPLGIDEPQGKPGRVYRDIVLPSGRVFMSAEDQMEADAAEAAEQLTTQAALPPTDEPSPFAEEFEQMQSVPQERAAEERPQGAPLCGLCGGAMWDNRDKKDAGTMKANAPDFACKNKECGGRVWKFKRLHWCDDPAVMPRLRAYANQHNVLTFAGILSLLNVKDLHDYDGTMADAKTIIDQYAAEHTA